MLMLRSLVPYSHSLGLVAFACQVGGRDREGRGGRGLHREHQLLAQAMKPTQSPNHHPYSSTSQPASAGESRFRYICDSRKRERCRCQGKTCVPRKIEAEANAQSMGVARKATCEEVLHATVAMNSSPTVFFCSRRI